MNISPAEPSERAEAFALLYGPASSAKVVCALQMVACGELNPAGLLIARDEQTIVGAIYAERLPGSLGLICPARTRNDEPGLEDALTAAAVRQLNGVKAIQAFLTSAEMIAAETLLRNRFQYVTRILEMARSASREIDRLQSAIASQVSLVPYLQVDSTTFQRTLALAHEESLDCPELDRARTPEELFAGYHDSSADRSRWYLAIADKNPVGLLLLSGQELSFLGVVPEYRGRGIGRFLIENACQFEPAISLTVDVRNARALQLYASIGFEVVGAREVFLNFLD